MKKKRLKYRKPIILVILLGILTPAFFALSSKTWEYVKNTEILQTPSPTLAPLIITQGPGDWNTLIAENFNLKISYPPTWKAKGGAGRLNEDGSVDYSSYTIKPIIDNSYCGISIDVRKLLEDGSFEKQVTHSTNSPANTSDFKEISVSGLKGYYFVTDWCFSPNPCRIQHIMLDLENGTYVDIEGLETNEFKEENFQTIYEIMSTFELINQPSQD